jgi:membrane-associated HD superfamily phosphohydrolase
MDETSLRFHSIKNRFVQLWYASRLWLIFAAGIIGTILSFSLSIHTQQGEVILSLNDVAPQDILAPYAFSDESEVLTEQARHRAATLVSPIYDPPDSNVSRQQINALQSALNFIDAVRADTHATHEQQLDDLAAIADIQINQETGEKLLNLADTRWQEIKLESISVLEQVMRREIRDTELKESKRAIPALVSISMTQDQASIVIHLVNGFVAANAKFNQDATTSASDQAREAVIPVTQSFAQGETIITRGEVVTALHIEALEAYGLLKPQNQWLEIALFSLLVITLGITLILYVYRTNQKAILEPRFAFATSILFIITSLGLQVMIPNHIVLPYLFPAATLPIYRRSNCRLLGITWIGTLPVRNDQRHYRSSCHRQSRAS